MCSYSDYKLLFKDSKETGYKTLGSCSCCGLLATLRQISDENLTLTLCGYCYDGWRKHNGKY